MLILVLVLVLKVSLRTYFKSLSLSWSLGVRSLSLSLGGQVQEVLVLVLGGQVLVLVLGGQVLVLVLVLEGQVLVNIPDMDKMVLDKMVRTKWYGQNGTDKILQIKSSINPAPIDNMIFHHCRFHFDAFSFPLCAYHLFVNFGY